MIEQRFIYNSTKLDVYRDNHYSYPSYLVVKGETENGDVIVCTMDHCRNGKTSFWIENTIIYRCYFINGCKPAKKAFAKKILDQYCTCGPEDIVTLPIYYQVKTVTRKSDGKAGNIYYLSDDPTEEQKTAFSRHGWDNLVAVPEYAPEMRKPAVFVPNDAREGVCYA